MSDQPLVSVIIPCYKQAEFLRTAVDSVLAQSYPNIEILVVDDSSPDNTEEVARSYGDRVIYLHRSNGGVSAARNTGISRAGGRYLKFLDADDHLAPEQIRRQVDAMEGREDRVCVTTARLYRDGMPEQYVDHVPQEKPLIPGLFNDPQWVPPHSYLFPARLVRLAGGFDEAYSHGEDWYFFCKVGLQQPDLKTDPRIGSYYRLRAGSLSTDRKPMAVERGQMLLELHDLLRGSGRADWFGIDLLRFEEGVYHALVWQQVEDRELLEALLTCILQLQQKLGTGHLGWRFRWMARLLGYARAERVRVAVVRRRKVKSDDALDTGAWREVK